MSELVQPFIMCGGSGTRLWPVSRASMPKQFQSFIGDRTLVQETGLRVSGDGFAAPAFVAAEQYRFLLRDQLEEIGIVPGPILLEPTPRNTAAVALAASMLVAEKGGGLVLLLPSDHIIKDAAHFREAVLSAVPAAQGGRICLFGIRPDRPEAGYGYIRVGEDRIPGPDSDVMSVSQFVEKPDRPAAEAMLKTGGYVWNSGIFLFAAETLLQEAGERNPELLDAVREAFRCSKRDGDAIAFDQKTFAAIPSVSIDYALMEGSERMAVLPVDLDWSDLGAWDAIFAAHQADADGNVVLGNALGVSTQNSFLRSDGPLVTTLGLCNTIVVASDDAILVADVSEAQSVKAALERLRSAGHPEVDSHKEVHRPWGSYRAIALGGRYQVKVITVKPGGRLSLQLHRHRAEHWVVVRGAAQITCGDKVFMLYENQSTYVPQGETHRLENPGRITLEMIEVQSGSYLGEDDIVRVEDVYGRS